MKKIVKPGLVFVAELSILFYIVMTMFAFAEDLEIKKFDGYLFEKFYNEKSTRTAMEGIFHGWLRGFSLGYMTGNIMGKWEEVKIYWPTEQEMGILHDKTKKEIFDKIFIKMEETMPGPNFKEDYNFYLRELISFYKTYPLCRRIELNPMLLELAQYWRGISEKTYKEIGEGCLDIKK